MTIEIYSLLVIHFLCNAQAETMPLAAREAEFCSANFETLKIELDPALTRGEYEAMNRGGRAKASVKSYSYYRRWLSDRPELSARLRRGAEIMLSEGKRVAAPESN